MKGKRGKELDKFIESGKKTRFKKGLKSMLGKHHTQKTKDKISETRKRRIREGKITYKVKNHTKEARERMRLSWKNVRKNEKEWKRIMKEMKEFEKKGFRCIPIGHRVIPDIIAIKDNKVFAVEVEYGKPNYEKYTDLNHYYDDIIWIVRKESHYKSKYKTKKHTSG